MFELRELEFKDLEIINKWRSNKEIVDLLGSNFRYVNFETEKLWFENYMKNRSNNVRLAVLVDGAIVGMVNLLKIDWQNRHCEYSIQIGETSSHSKGLGTFATRAALDHAFNDLGLNKVYLSVLTGNPRAIKVYEKVGFKHEGTLREEVFKNNKFEDVHLMSILRKEFETANC